MNIWDEAANVVRATMSYRTMDECRAELGRIAARGPAVGQKAFCFPEPPTNYTPLQTKPPAPPQDGEDGQSGATG